MKLKKTEPLTLNGLLVQAYVKTKITSSYADRDQIASLLR